MTDEQSTKPPAPINPWPHVLFWAGLVLAIIGPFISGGGATQMSEGSNVFIGVTSNDVASGQRLIVFGQAAATAGLVSVAMALALWAVAWRPKIR